MVSDFKSDTIRLASGAMLDPKVFKAYDVRGIHPTEIDEGGAYRVGRAFVERFGLGRIAVGRDMRLSAPTMTAAVIDGAADGGAEVLDLGMVGTEMLYYAVGELDLEGGVVVTASHNPKHYSGMKIVRAGALPVGGDSGLDDVRRAAEEGFGDVVRRGEVTPTDIWEGFVAKVLSFVDPASIRPLRIVIDAANGMAGTMLPRVLEELPQLDVVRCYFEPDGSFPNHEPNPLLPENREFIVERTRAEGADLGVAYDGDADRCFFVDDTGEFVPGDFVTALLARAMLEKERGATVLYDVRASWAVPRTIEEAGGVALVNRVGHAFIKERMREVDALFAGEVSAHYYFRDFTRADTGVVPFLVMLELLSGAGERLSELLAPFRERYFLSGEINTPVADVDAKLREIEERYADAGARISHLDGVSVDFEDWHFNVRPSNTEPLLRLNLEALDEGEMERRRDEVLDLIRS
jgi:phosphomannomutase